MLLRISGFALQGSGFGFTVQWVRGLGCGVGGADLVDEMVGVSGFGFRVSSIEFRVSNFECRANDFGFRVLA